MERSEIVSQILAILEDVAEISPEDVTEDSVLMDDLDLSSMEILTVVADLEETFGLRIPEKELREDNIIPSVFNRDVVPAVAKAVAEAARRTGVARA